MVVGRTYGTLRFERDLTGAARWVMDEVPPHVSIRLKHIFARVPKSATPPFVFDTSLATLRDLDWFLERYPMAMTKVDRSTIEAGARTYEAKAAEVERIMAKDYVAPEYGGFREGVALRHYQAQAVEMLRRSRGLLDADEGGLGKTITAAGAMLLPGMLPAAVVMQVHLQKQWQERIEQYTNLRVHMIKGTKPYQVPEADVYLFRYSQLVGWVDVFKLFGPRLVVYDEVQELRTGTGTDSDPILKGMAASELSKRATSVLGLTGTPIMNYGVEIWNVMSFIRPEVLGSYDDFLREWASGGRLKDPEALGAYLREQHAFLRRRKPDVGMELPKVNRIVQYIDYDHKTVADMEVLARRLALTAATGTFHERGQATRELDLRMRQATGIAKARAVAAFVRILVEGGTPVVVAGWHREVYAIWLRALGDLNPAMYTGSESGTQKNKELQRFLDGKTDILIISLRSAAGIDGIQHRCSTIVLGELDWSPGIHQQLIWRVDRDGQTEPVSAFFLVVDDGSDPPMMEVNGVKASEAQGVVDPGLGVVETHVDSSVLQRLVQRYLAAPRGALAAVSNHDNTVV